MCFSEIEVVIGFIVLVQLLTVGVANDPHFTLVFPIDDIDSPKEQLNRRKRRLNGERNFG
jgi:hypothetical protein